MPSPIGVKKDSELTAASAGNIDNTAYWGIVDKLGASVKMTFAQLKTFYNAVTSVTGDATASIVAGVATLTIGAGKIVNSMLANNAVDSVNMVNAAVTLPKLANLAASSIIANPTGGSATPQATTLDTDLVFSGTSLALKHPRLITHLAADFVSSTPGTLENTGLVIPVVAGKSYWFEFELILVGSASNVQVRFNVAIPSGGVFGLTEEYLDAGPSNLLHYYSHTNPSGFMSTGLDLPAARRARVTGCAQVSGSGNLQLQIDTSAAVTVSVKKDSFGHVLYVF